MDCYAFGATKGSYVVGGSADKYKFTGKERDTETGLDYFGARYYDSKIGRWMSVDPLADKYPGLSPYNYCANNPLIYIDSDGQEIGGPGILFGVAGGMEVIGGALVSAGIAATAIIGPNKVGQGMQDAGEWIQGQAGKLVDEITGNDFKSTPFPNSQGEGINKTTIAPSDATSVFKPNLESTDTSNGKNEKHGDNGRAKTKAEKQIEKYKEQLNTATGSDAKKIRKKMERAQKNAQRKEKGEEHSRGVKG